MKWMDSRLLWFLFRKHRVATAGVFLIILFQNLLWFSNTFFNVAMTNAAIERRFHTFLLYLAGVAVLMLILLGFKYAEVRVQNQLKNIWQMTCANRPLPCRCKWMRRVWSIKMSEVRSLD